MTGNNRRMRWSLILSVAIAATACGDDGSTPVNDARAPVPDARTNDGPIDAAPAAPCTGCVICASQNDDNQFVDGESVSGDRWIAMKFRMTLTRNVRHVQVFTGEVSGASTMRIYSNSGAPEQPDTMIGFGTFNMGQFNGWQGAAMDVPVSVNANTDHWIAWFALDGAQSPRAPMGMAVTFRESTDDGANWSAESASTLKYRIYCDP